MQMLPEKITTVEEYKRVVEAFYYLVDEEMKWAETIKEKNDHSGLSVGMPKLISLVNCIGYLRGQDNAFLDIRPAGVSQELQKELYRYENEFEARLHKLILYLNASPSKVYYKECLEQYFIKASSASV